MQSAFGLSKVSYLSMVHHQLQPFIAIQITMDSEDIKYSCDIAAPCTIKWLFKLPPSSSKLTENSNS